jgi:hypothetical protein
MAKKVSLGKVLAELRDAIKQLEHEDPAWTDQQKKKAKNTARLLKNLADITEADCTDGQQSVPH